MIGPCIDRRLIHDCWANRTGKGSHRAVLRYQRFAQRYRWVLKADIRKYFPSVDHQLLKTQFRDRFKEAALLALLDRIVDAGEVPEPFDSYFPGDNLWTPQSRPKGLPIGNLTSQLWANLYLDPFDHWVKEELRVAAYLRFVDDFLVLSNSKETLERWRRAIEQRLGELRLTVHRRKSVIRRVNEGIPFLGYVVWPNKIRVLGETVRRYRKRLRARNHTQPDRQVERQRSLAAWRGHVSLAGSFRRSQILKDRS